MMCNSFFRRTISGLLCAVMLACSLSTLAVQEYPTAHATYWYGTMFVEGYEVYFAQNGQIYEPINLNGNIYVPLFAIGEWTSRNVKWDKSTKEIILLHHPMVSIHYRSAGELPIYTDEQFDAVDAGRTTGFEVTVLTDTTVIWDGGTITTTSEQGTPLHPIVHKGIPYLSMRTAAQLSEKTLLYLSDPPPVPSTLPVLYLYEKPTQAQIQEALSFLDEMDANIKFLDEYTPVLARTTTIQQLHDGLMELDARMMAIKEPSIPSIPMLTTELVSLYRLLELHYRPRLLRDIALSAPTDAPNTSLGWLGEARRFHSENTHVFAISTLTNFTTRLRQITNGMAAGELR